MKLVGLSPGAVAELAEPYGTDADELYDKTAGNPFFVVEALAAGAEAIPDTVRDAVLARVARLGPSRKAVLEAVAVVPSQAELWLLEAIAGEPLDGLDDCLDSRACSDRTRAASSSGTSSRGSRSRNGRRPVGSSSSTGQRWRRWPTPPAGTADLARLAHHADAAGDADAVIRYAPAAAARAAALGAHREAAAQYARTLRVRSDLRRRARADLLHLRVDRVLRHRRHRRGD